MTRWGHLVSSLLNPMPSVIYGDLQARREATLRRSIFAAAKAAALGAFGAWQEALQALRGPLETVSAPKH